LTLKRKLHFHEPEAGRRKMSIVLLAVGTYTAARHKTKLKFADGMADGVYCHPLPFASALTNAIQPIKLSVAWNHP